MDGQKYGRVVERAKRQYGKFLDKPDDLESDSLAAWGQKRPSVARRCELPRQTPGQRARESGLNLARA
jgi:hypothetical protein